MANDQSSPFRPMLALALPVLAEESLNLLVGYTDWFLAGRFLPGDEPKAAMGLVAYILWMLPSLFSLIGIGALAVVARLIGAGERREAAHVTRQALALGCLVAAVGIVAALMLAGPFVAAMQLERRAAGLAVRYIHILAPAIPFIMLEQIGTACLRGSGDTVSGLVARAFVNVMNATISTLLVTGLGPFPQLGWDGLAVGTLCGHIVGGLIIFERLARGRGGLHLFDRDPAASAPWIDGLVVRRILRIGVPGGVDIWSVLAGHLAYAAIINSLGVRAQAAHGLGLQIEAMSYLPGSAFGVAAATLAGQSLGAADPRRAMHSVLACAAMAAGIMTLAGLVMFFGGETIARFFTGAPTETALLTGRLLKIVALSCPFLALLIVFLGALRGSGDTRWPLAITIVGLVGVRLPGACLLAWAAIPLPIVGLSLPGAGLGVAGAWWAMVIDVILRSALAALRFAHGGWRRVHV